jgi:hypothetical protein
MTQNFAFPAFGWHRDLSLHARQEIKCRFPKLPVDRISSEAGWYVIRRDAKYLSPDEARKTLRRLQRQARELHDGVLPLALGPLRSFVDQAAGLIESQIALNDFRIALLYFERAFAKAATSIPAGRRRSPRERLVRALAGILLEAGQAIDAKPQGALCTLVSIVLSGVRKRRPTFGRSCSPSCGRWKLPIKSLANFPQRLDAARPFVCKLTCTVTSTEEAQASPPWPTP